MEGASEVWDLVRIMPSHPSFSSISPIYCKTSCPRHDVKLHNYASRLLQQHMARAYGQDTVTNSNVDRSDFTLMSRDS